MFDGLRFEANTYVVGRVDLSTREVAATPVTGQKWSDFQTF
jgi:hypothetical protein